MIAAAAYIQRNAYAGTIGNVVPFYFCIVHKKTFSQKSHSYDFCEFAFVVKTLNGRNKSALAFSEHQLFKYFAAQKRGFACAVH